MQHSAAMRGSILLCALLVGCGSPISPRDGESPADVSVTDAAFDQASPDDSTPPVDVAADGSVATDVVGAPDGAADPPTFIVTRGALLFSDDFSSGALAPNWQIVGGNWAVVDQHAVGSQPPGGSDPNIGHMIACDRAVMQFAFNFSAGDRAGIRLNHKDTTNNQHLVNALVDANSVALRQMSGWGSTTMSMPLDMAAVPTAAGRWHTGVLEIYDRRVAFSIDGRMVVMGMTVDQSATPRNHFVLEAFGAMVMYDDVKVWEALPR